MSSTTKACHWDQEDLDSDCYVTDCGHYFSVPDGTPEDNEMRFCCFCGRRLVARAYNVEED